ncbi:uncharacterized protein LY89DRAFT_988 [Mollisia scopiformis]|uniref:Uncharacterized protein n=1 Tax=Mollisia scopiformis TaxID=149040 RepID=A0A194XU90_MOLSC|nr:uncharacterized protein LY89DRAFT_988 [Mollisia scopiformis]KUJ23706.1 hypothetical protein LY89DRAFT_988 [Mollisia scopiformis]
MRWWFRQVQVCGSLVCVLIWLMNVETPMAITYETPRHETGLEEDKSGDGGNLATVRNEKAVESRERSSQSARYALNAQNAQIALVAPVERPESASWTKITTDVLWKEWLEHETAKNLERSDPLRRLGFQLEMAESLLDLDFALTQELLLSAVFEYLSDVTIPSEHRLRSTPEQKLASKTSYDWMLPWDYSLFRLPAELQKRIWREYTNRLRTHLQMRLDGIRAENEDTLVLGSLDNDDFNLITMGMLAKIVLLCAKRAGENEVQMVLREIITKANSCQGTQAEIVSAYAQLCYAMHCVWRSGGKSSRALAEYEASIRKIIEKMEHCEQRVRLVRLYNTVRQTINVLALTPEALGT